MRANFSSASTIIPLSVAAPDTSRTQLFVHSWTSMSNEKIETQHIDEKDPGGRFRHVESAEEQDGPEILSTFEEKRLLRKLDMRILPIACLMYIFACAFLSYCLHSLISCADGIITDLDRSNLGNARLQGLPADVLHGDASGKEFDWINSAFFFSYVTMAHSSITCSMALTALSLTDPMSSACDYLFEVCSSSSLVGWRSDWVGNLLYSHGNSRLHSLGIPNSRFN